MKRKRTMHLGVMVRLDDMNVDARFKQVYDYGFKYCQLCNWKMEHYTDEAAELVRAAKEKYGVTITSLWCGWEGPRVWNFYEGYKTLGLVPREYREARISNLKLGSDFAKKLGIKQVVTHAGFLPEDPTSEIYTEVVAALREIAEYCKANGQYFLFETGQETPVTLLRVIDDVGTGNLGINLDPANLILYGKANPVDALDVFGRYVMDIHAKDGIYPTDGKSLGKEVRIGEGKVDFPRFIARLREIGYDGSLIIEREISGEQQIKDIVESKKYLEELI